MILIIDNYDSFTYTLVQSVGALGATPVVRMNDEMTAGEVKRMAPRGIILSSGAGTPEEAGRCVEFVEAFAETVPLLGVGLGHQCIAVAFGGTLKPGIEPMHGKADTVEHDGKGLFAGLHLPFAATRYDSTVVCGLDLPAELQVTATTEKGEIVGLRHRSLPVEGVQFHPGSILTVNGQHMMQNFLAMTDTVRAA